MNRISEALDQYTGICKAGKKTPHIGRFWSGCAGAVKHGLEIMGLGLIDIDSHNCMMLRAHQTTACSRFARLLLHLHRNRRGYDGPECADLLAGNRKLCV